MDVILWHYIPFSAILPLIYKDFLLKEGLKKWFLVFIERKSDELGLTDLWLTPLMSPDPHGSKHGHISLFKQILKG